MAAVPGEATLAETSAALRAQKLADNARSIQAALAIAELLQLNDGEEFVAATGQLLDSISRPAEREQTRRTLEDFETVLLNLSRFMLMSAETSLSLVTDPPSSTDEAGAGGAGETEIIVESSPAKASEQTPPPLAEAVESVPKVQSPTVDKAQQEREKRAQLRDLRQADFIKRPFLIRIGRMN